MGSSPSKTNVKQINITPESKFDLSSGRSTSAVIPNSTNPKPGPSTGKSNSTDPKSQAVTNRPPATDNSVPTPVSGNTTNAETNLEPNITDESNLKKSTNSPEDMASRGKATTPSGNKTVFPPINKTPESNKTANDKPTNDNKLPSEMNVRNAIRGRYNVLPGPPAAPAANDNNGVPPGPPVPAPASPVQPNPVPRQAIPIRKPETPEEAHNRIMEVYKTKSSTHLSKWEDNKQDKMAQAHLIDATNSVFFGMRGYSDQWIQKHRTAVCEYILEKRNIVTAICEGTMIAKSIQELNNSFTQTALLVIVNLSDHSRELSKAICAIPGYIKFLYDILNDNSKSATNDYNVQKLIIRVLMIIHNVAMTDSNIPMLQEMKFTPLLHTFLSFTNDTIRMTAILAMADIMKEDESHYVEANSDVLVFLIKMFRSALFNTSRTAKDGHGMIWGVLELAKGIGRLARNDGNKKVLVEKGCLPLLLKLAKSTDLEEQKEALKSIWALAFDETNQERIIQEPGMVQFLETQNKSGAADTKSTCYGILWTMRYKLLKSDDYKELGIRLTAKQSASPTPHNTKEKAELEKSEKEEKSAKGHVMISYQWANQEILMKIRDRIRSQGEKVWMDIDDMEGSTLQAMAEAIEHADVVLICMSRKYKDSPNCRAEAEYAHQLRKKVIPLIMEKGYRPDGWLGMILGAKLFYDFSGKYPFESKIDGLLREVHQTMNGGEKATTLSAPIKTYDEVDGPEEEIVPERRAPLYTAARAPPPKLSEVKNWNPKQIKDWLTKHKLSGARVEKLTGKEVAFLQKLQSTAPEFYYQTLKSDVGLKNLTEMANFEAAMDELP